jgi:hypothetical protein
MNLDDDYRPGDEFDWDQSDESQYCKHGTFIGSSWGPDLMCWACEDGISDEDWTEYLEAQRRRAAYQRARNALIDDLIGVLETFAPMRRNPSEYINEFFTDLKEAERDPEAIDRYLAAV